MDPSVFVKHLKGSKTGDPIKPAKIGFSGKAEDAGNELKGSEKPQFNSYQGLIRAKDSQKGNNNFIGEHEYKIKVWNKNSNVAGKRLKK